MPEPGGERTARRVALPVSPFALVVAGIALLGFVIRLAMVLRGGGLTGNIVYDDGVYYAAADALVHGRLPYRDFLFLQPPGIVLALAPFAALGTATSDPVGLAAARLVFLAVGGVNAALVALAGRRYGRAAGVVAGLAYAVFHPAVFAERSTLLEPLGTLGIVTAVVLAGRALDGRPRSRLLAVLAGVAGAVAVLMKLWYAAPLAVLLVFQHRERLRLLLGAAAGAAVLGLPFLIAAPAAAIQQLLLDQLGRPRHADWTLGRRLESIAGALSAKPPGVLGLLPRSADTAVVLGLVVVLGIATATVQGARVIPVLLAVSVVLLLASPAYYPHYVALPAPWTALVLGIGSVRIGRLLPRQPLSTAAVAAIALAPIVLISVRADATSAGVVVPTRALSPAAQAVRCVTTDDPVVLAELDVLSADLSRGCRLWPDVTGWTYDRDKGYGPGFPVELSRRKNPRWQRDLLTYLRSGNAVLLDRPDTGLDASSLRVIHSGRVLAARGVWVLRAGRS